MSLQNFLALEASAGSGKTFALSVRYLSLLFMGANPQKIVALTFTNKSASEMKTRIFETLKNLENKSELEHISLQTNKSKEQLLKEKNKIMQTLLQADIKISTLDSFFTLILRHFALNVGLSGDFSVGADDFNEQFVSRFIKKCKNAKLYDALIALSLNEDKRLSDIFVLLENLYEKKSEYDIRLIKDGSYSSFAPILAIIQKIKSIFEQSGFGDSGLKTFDTPSLKELLKKGFLGKEDFYYWHYKKYANEQTNLLLEELKEAIKEHIKAKEEYFLGTLSKLYSIYEQSIKEQCVEYGKLRFNDVTNILYELLRGDIGNDFLYFRLDGAVEHLLVDEFQDTSIVQYKILLPLIEEIRSGKGVKDFRTLFFVGDIKQSIYRFRGGAKELFGYAKKELSLNTDSLDTNYRSTQVVVEFVNDTFAKKIKGYETQKVSKENLTGEGFVKVSTKEKIEELALEAVKTLLEHGAKPHDIALLVHTNKDAKEMKEFLQEHFEGTLHVRLEASLRLVQVRFIKAIIAFLKYLYFNKETLYKAEFLTLCGRRWSEQVDITKYNLSATPLLLVKQIVKDFALYDGSADIPSFLELSSQYQDIESFIFALDELSSEAKSEDTEGLRVLTIHKSKGLEFEHVILCDRKSKENNRSDSLLFSYDDINVENIFLTMSNRETLDKRYEIAKNKEQILQSEDKLNALYVAFTRAKCSLFVCAKEQDSAFDVLELQQMQKGTIRVAEKKAEQKPQAIQIFTPKRYGSQNLTLKDEKTEIALNNSILFGTAQHYLLEMLDSFSKEALDRAFVALQNRYTALLDKQSLDMIYQRSTNLITNEQFLNLINGAKILKEQPLMYQKERKQIDLLLEFEDKIIVIDYKSSKKGHEKHIEQIRLYQEALKEIYARPVLGYICYLHNDGIELVKSL